MIQTCNDDTEALYCSATDSSSFLTGMDDCKHINQRVARSMKRAECTEIVQKHNFYGLNKNKLPANRDRASPALMLINNGKNTGGSS